MIKSKGILTISIISLFAVESAYAAIASSGYVDQQVGTKISEVHANTVANDETANVVTSISAEGNTVTATKGITAEETKNKVKTIRTDGTATDTAYPSEKAVATALDAKQDKLEGEVLTNTATGSGSVSTGGADPVTTSNAIAIGDLASAQNGGISLGSASSALSDGVSVGTQSSASGQAVVIGAESSASGLSSIAIGSFASADAEHAIQLGAGTNSEANTLSVGFDEENNYKLLGIDGKIPAERLPFEGDVLTNTATGKNSVSTGWAFPVSAADAFAVGIAASAGTGAMAIGSGSSASGQGMAVGQKAKALKEGSFAIGQGAISDASYSSAIGTMATASAERAIQIGQGTNSEANTFSVGLDGTNNYKLLGSDGKIPAERLPFTGDVLTNTATGSNSFSTGGATAASAANSIALGNGANTNASSSVAVGASSSASAKRTTVLGASATAGGEDALAVGAQAQAAGNSSTAVGTGASSTGSASVALGGGANSQADNAIQLGAGTNSEANTLSVGLDGTNNYKLLGSDGKIPAERLPFEGDVLTNTATGTDSFSTGGANVTTGNLSLAIGVDAATGSSGEVAVGAAAMSGGYSSVAVGNAADATGGNAVAVGQNSLADSMNSTAVGQGAKSTANGGTALGHNAKVTAEHAIQLGAGTNSEANTLSVGFDEDNNYKLLGIDGKIPAERLPFEGDVLTNTATGSNSFSTGGAFPVSGDAAAAIGVGATVQNSGTAIGYLTSSGGSGVALGARASSNKTGGVSMGSDSAVEGNGGIAVGMGAQSAGEQSISIGMGAGALSNYAIQLGHGMNAEANTLSVGLSTSNNYKLLGSDGKIPAERLPAATASTLGGVKSGGDVSISSTGAVSVVSSLKAVQDANGDNIAATYATKDSVEDLQANKVKVDWTTSNVNKVLVIGSDSNYPDVYGKVTVAKITENFLDNAIKNKLSNAVTSVATSGSGAVVTGFSKSGNSMTVTKSNVKIPVGSATATTYATIWVE
ncbi:MAG TPA: hypothetical protein IAC63_03605 [Candidatus Enterousia avicola]|uniref:Trimeric autotransporter adhesin YadA-like head domain-containing protein n=1 Tax=Candidatus Enterousia avicola TaxID=2840787 RepID=A0A9D1MSL3_9PROT|nr:hypothetical protein [Candidatus Enterousia avicola]